MYKYKIYETHGIKNELVIELPYEFSTVNLFLLTDAKKVYNHIKNQINIILNGDKEYFATGGSMCSLEINKNKTIVKSLSDPENDWCEIKTDYFLELMEIWNSKLEIYNRIRN